jgi:hypothetical protein
MLGEEVHVALPRLHGAPPYARPRLAVELTQRPLDPDDLPIAAAQTLQERRLADRLLAHPDESVSPVGPARDDPRPEQRLPPLRAFAEMILRRPS